MPGSATVIIAGLVLIDPFVADMDWKPVRDPSLGDALIAPHEDKS
jgi:hypothetical protein